MIYRCADVYLSMFINTMIVGSVTHCLSRTLTTDPEVHLTASCSLPVQHAWRCPVFVTKYSRCDRLTLPVNRAHYCHTLFKKLVTSVHVNLTSHHSFMYDFILWPKLPELFWWFAVIPYLPCCFLHVCNYRVLYTKATYPLMLSSLQIVVRNYPCPLE